MKDLSQTPTDIRDRPAAGPRCSHCGRPRIAAPLRVLRTAQARYPIPGLDSVFQALGRYYEPWQTIYVCMTCMCLTADPSETHEH